jgi:UDP-glucose 4-epimerase
MLGWVLVYDWMKRVKTGFFFLFRQCGCMRVFVSGGAGFIGSHLVDRLLGDGFEVVVLDDLCGGRVENVKQHIGESGFRFVRGDVRDSGLVEGLVRGVDAVFHLAALVSVPESFEDPVLTNDVNVGGTLNLLRACVGSDVKRFVYASSCAVYGEAESLPLREDSPLRPASPYAVSKLAAENYVRVFYEVFGLETVCLRFFNVYGSRQVYSEYSGVMTQFFSCLTKDRPLVIFGDGEQTRDFVHVRDVVEANMLALKNEGVVGEVFNVATGVATTINQLANVLLRTTNQTHLKMVHSETRKGDIKHSVADISKARRKLHYDPKVLLKDGVKELTIS